MTDTREFSTAAIASVATGYLLCTFSEMQEAAEFLMGHPIWTHHFADKELVNEMRDAIARQCPAMPTRGEVDGTITKDNYKERLAEIEAHIGKTVKITKGAGLTAMLPTDGIPEHVKVIPVQT